MRKITTIAQITILIGHLSIMLYFKYDRNESIKILNKSIKELNLEIEERNEDIRLLNEGLGDITPKLDSLNNHKPCFN